jgi:hypothetical protein
MGLEQVAEMSMPELEIWMAYFRLQAEEQRKAMQNGRTGRKT